MTDELLARIERTYDALPRAAGARVERVGPFELFVREGSGWPFYARPRLGADQFTVYDVEAVLHRQREINNPEAIEWVLDATPDLLDVVQSRMAVELAPLMVLDPAGLPDADPRGLARLLDPDQPDFLAWQAASAAVAAIAFSPAGTAADSADTTRDSADTIRDSAGTRADSAGTRADAAGTGADCVGRGAESTSAAVRLATAAPAGPAQRDGALRPLAPERLEVLVRDLRSGRTADAVVSDPADGIVARGSYQSALGGAEIVGVATLPSHRRQGHAAAVSALLARHALANGNDLVFLSAADETVARVYAGIGFRRIGTAGIASRG